MALVPWASARAQYPVGQDPAGRKCRIPWAGPAPRRRRRHARPGPPAQVQGGGVEERPSHHQGGDGLRREGRQFQESGRELERRCRVARTGAPQPGRQAGPEGARPEDRGRRPRAVEEGQSQAQARGRPRRAFPPLQHPAQGPGRGHGQGDGDPVQPPQAAARLAGHRLGREGQPLRLHRPQGLRRVRPERREPRGRRERVVRREPGCPAALRRGRRPAGGQEGRARRGSPARRAPRKARRRRLPAAPIGPSSGS